MKLITLIFTFFLIISCNSLKNKPNDNNVLNVLTPCPEDGICSFEIQKNKVLTIHKDEFGNRYQRIEDGNQIVAKFQYVRNEIIDVADSGYIEELFIELNPDEMEQHLSNSELKNVKLLFARLCFCRGQTGYYEIIDGDLKISKITDANYELSLEFKTDEVPQVISIIKEQFAL